MVLLLFSYSTKAGDYLFVQRSFRIDGIGFFEPLGELAGVMSLGWGSGSGLSIADPR